MVLMPAPCAFFRQAEPESLSRFVMSRTLTPAVIRPSQSVPNFALSPLALRMSASMPAAVKASVSSGRSLASQRGEVVESGRMTPTLPLGASAEGVPPDAVSLESEPPPQAVRARVQATASTAARDRVGTSMAGAP